ncbi:MAG: rhodanese-like domain-containing protein [Hydrogenophaga sp.]|uniref:sulfurtransferase n=1 Tax=Hydrogenophaga sp. TaxID=1904254 RepID=UPI00273159D9|nr:rhodanese-like domain-containing protein [Hydrogenophaga sp.]MDP2164204.1 rhodanese-like domain-containing protein [Hydrogenophaga sp.]
MNKRHNKWEICRTGTLAGLLLCAGIGTAFAHHVIVDTDYVLNKKDKPGVVLVDARAASDYKKGLIPGAVVLGEKPGAVALRDVNARILPVKNLEKILGDAGITREHEIIVYGAKGDTDPDVVFWILEYLGAEKAKVYHGGMDDWTTAKNSMKNEARKLPAAKFTAKVRADVLATTNYVKKSLKNKEVQFIDSRTAKEHSGDDIRSLRGGNIAAVNQSSIPYESAWKDPEALTKLAEKKVDNRDGVALQDMAALKEPYKGVDPKKEVVAYCQTGTRSTQTYAVLREMGYQKVRNYDDSWIIYGANPDLPVNNVTYFDFVKVNTALKTLQALEKRLTGLEPKK